MLISFNFIYFLSEEYGVQQEGQGTVPVCLAYTHTKLIFFFYYRKAILFIRTLSMHHATTCVPRIVSLSATRSCYTKRLGLQLLWTPVRYPVD